MSPPLSDDSKKPARIELNDQLSLYEQKVVEGCTIDFQNPKFRLIMRDPSMASADSKNSLYGGSDKKSSDPAASGIFEITDVMDSWKDTDLRNEFNKRLAAASTSQAALHSNFLTEEDRLMFRDEEMEPKKELWKYPNLADRAEIIIKREDVGQAAIKYICADCGEEVRLKKNDEVRCRQCGYRIVYKKRTTAACQYLAR